MTDFKDERDEAAKEYGERVEAYRNGVWHTLGTPMYLDLTADKSKYADYVAKVSYFNLITLRLFASFYTSFKFSLEAILGKEVNFLCEHYPHAAYPGFHIFQNQKGLTAFTGKKHCDLQWYAFEMLPGFPFKKEQMTNHFSLTLPLKLPYLGASLVYGEQLENVHDYKERALCVHSGQFPHAIAPYGWPVLPFDYRITWQAHGFEANNKIYLYW